MRMQLCIFDVSPFIHSSRHVDKYANLKQYGFPVGGIRYFMKYLTSELARDRDVICTFDDSSSFRRDMLKDYKSGRTQDPIVNIQRDLLFETLIKCGVSCYREKSYEADDLIYTAVQQNKANYHYVSVFGNDYDLAHNVDENKVIFQSMSSNTNNINANNFRNSVQKGEYIAFNTISAYKSLCGCSSDSIPAFKAGDGETGLSIYKKFAQYMETTMSQFGTKVSTDPRILLSFLKTLGTLTPEDFKQILIQVNLAYPSTAPVEVKPSNLKDIDKYLMAQFIYSTKCDEAIRNLEYKFTMPSEESTERLKKLARNLNTGEFAVDNSLTVYNNPIDSEILELSDMRKF